MGRYFIHVENGDGAEPDHDGHDFVDDEAAIMSAGKTVGDMLVEDLHKGRDRVAIKLQIERDDRRKVALVVVQGSVIRQS